MDKEINLGYPKEYFGLRNENETIEDYFSRCEKEINKIDAAIEKLEDKIREREEKENNNQ